MKKRLISILLVVAMLVCMIPAHAADAETGTSYVYNLARLQYGQWSSEGVNPSTLTDWDSIDALENYFGRTTDPFMFYGQSSGIDWRWTGSSNNEVGPTINGGVGEWGGIVIRVGKSAVYDVSMRLLDNAAAASLDFYLAPYDAENPQSAEYYLGSSAYTETTGTLKMTSFGEQYLEAGDYAVIFKVTQKGTAYTAISNVTLTWVTDEKPAEQPKSYVYNLARLQYGQWSTEGYSPDTLVDWDSIYAYDTYYDRPTDPFMYYGASDTLTWSWTATSNNGNGPTIEGASGAWGGMKIRVGESAQYNITITSLDNVSAANLKFYLAPVDAIHPRADQYYLGTTAFTGNGTSRTDFDFGTKYLEAGDYTLVFQLASTATALTTVSQVALDGVSYDEPEPQPKDYHYNLARLQYGQWSTEGVSPSAITSWGALYDLDNYYNRTSDPFMHYGQSSEDTNVLNWNWTGSSNNGVGPTINGVAGEWAGIKIRVGQSAQYHITTTMRDDASASSLKFYLAPASVAEPKTDTYYIGSPKFSGSGSLNTFTFGEQYLEAGDYVLVYEIVSKGTNFTSLAAVDLTWVSFGEDCVLATQDGASVRITGEMGQRFKSSISKEFLEGADVVEYGTILMPTEDLEGDIAGNLVVGYSYGSHTVAEVPAVNLHSEDAENVYFTAVLIRIPTQYYSRSITARAYAKLSDGTYVYGDTTSSRSILEVAQNGLAEGSGATDAEKTVFEQIVADADAANA